MHEGKFGFHPMCKEIGLTHLSFADDIMVFMDGQAASLKGVMDVLDSFGCMSGLKINAEKSSLFIGGKLSDDFYQSATTFGFPLAELPIRYLGLPLTKKTMIKVDYEPLIDRIRVRLLSWANKSLSFAWKIAADQIGYRKYHKFLVCNLHPSKKML